MKILHVIARLSVHDGGPTKAVREMARAVAELGHEVWIYTTDMVEADEPAPPLDRLVEEGGVRIGFFPVCWPRAWKRSPGLGRALAEKIPECDLVVIHSLYLYHDWKAASLCRKAGVPYVIRPHGTLDPFLWQRRRWLKSVFEWAHQNRDLREAAALHYTTDAERDLAQPYVQGATGFVVPLGIWPEQYAIDVRERQGNTLLYLGRLHPKKGIELLLEAFARLRKDHSELRLLIAGSGATDYVDALRALRDKHQLQEAVEFCGFVDGAEKQALLRRADVFLLPSYSENFGIAVIEAMAAGLPVLISRHVNLCDAVVEAGAGWVCDAELDSLEAHLRQALAERKQWPDVGARGQALVEARYTWPAVGRQLENAYQRILKASL